MAILHKNINNESDIHVPKWLPSANNGDYAFKNEKGELESIDELLLPAALNFVDGSVAPPTTSVGDIYILSSGASVNAGWGSVALQDWVRYDGALWNSLTPQKSSLCYDKTADALMSFNGTAWAAIGAGGGTDANAVHVNVGAEIAAITAKATPTTSDIILIEDAADLNKKKKITIGDLPSSGGGNTIYSANDTIGAGRVATLTDTLTFSNAQLIIKGDLVNNNYPLTVQNSAGSTKFQVKNNGNVDIKGEDITLTDTSLSSTLYITKDSTDLHFGYNGVNVHSINNKNFLLTAFYKNGFSATKGFLIGGSSKIGSELISLQGQTAIKGENTLSTASALQIYDGDSTPNLLWDFKNDGTLTGNKSKTALIAQNSITNSDADFVFRCRKSNNAIDFLFVGNGGEVRLGTSATNTSTGDKSTHILWAGDIVTQAGASNYSILMGHSVSANYTGESVVGLGKSITINGQRQYGIGDNITLGGQNAVGIGRNLSMSSGANVSIGLDNTQNNAYGVLLGLNLETNANGASIIGRGTNSSSKVVNNTANSLALGWESTTPQYLFAATGATIKTNLDMDNNRITNAVVNPSVQEVTSSATFTINADEQSDGVLTAMAAATTIAAPTGTPVQSQSLVFRFTDNGTARAITWNAIFRAIGVTLPTTTTANKLLYVGCKYNSTGTKWDVVSVQEEA